jgi:hypothetical protein
MLDTFSKYHMKIFLEDFTVRKSRKDIFKSITGNESLCNINNGNGVRVVNFAISKNLTVKSTCSKIITSIFGCL